MNVQQNLPLCDDSVQEMLSKIDWSFPNSKPPPIDSIHPYPAKFIREIPTAFLDSLNLKKGTAVLDPFCGCGTTLTTAQAKGVESYGIDLNPIACLISRVKTRKLPDDFAKIARSVVRAAESEEISPPSDIPNLDHWFEQDVQKKLAALKSQISAIQDPALRDALNLAQSAITVRVSNQESDTRYAAVQKSVQGEHVLDMFLDSARKIESSFKGFPTNPPSSVVIESDIYDVDPDLITKPIGMVITSPPYPNAYEYWLYHKYRMYWLGFDPKFVKDREIGARAHFFSSKTALQSQDFGNQSFRLFELLSKLVIPGGYVCIVVGDSKIHGEIFNNAEIMRDSALQCGFEHQALFDRSIRQSRKSFNLKNSRARSERILVLRNSKN